MIVHEVYTQWQWQTNTIKRMLMRLFANNRSVLNNIESHRNLEIQKNMSRQSFLSWTIEKFVLVDLWFVLTNQRDEKKTIGHSSWFADTLAS